MIEIKKEKKLWNNYQTWDKTKAYQSSKLGENDLMFEKTFFFFYFPFLVSEPLSSYHQLGVIFFFLFLCVRVPYIYKEMPLSSYNKLGVIFFFLFLCVRVPYIYKEMQILSGVRGGQVPPSPHLWVRHCQVQCPMWCKIYQRLRIKMTHCNEKV